DEHGAAPGQLVHDEPVVNDFLSNVDRSPQLFQSDFNNIDRPDNARAKSSGLGKQHCSNIVWHYTVLRLETLHPNTDQPARNALLTLNLFNVNNVLDAVGRAQKNPITFLRFSCSKLPAKSR